MEIPFLRAKASAIAIACSEDMQESSGVETQAALDPEIPSPLESCGHVYHSEDRVAGPEYEKANVEDSIRKLKIDRIEVPILGQLTPMVSGYRAAALDHREELPGSPS